MKQTSQITIQAPLNKVFATTSDLARWPEFLPHYRYNRFLSHTPSGGVVRMSSVRSKLASAIWVCEYRIDTEKRQLHFRHLKSTLNATLGMKAVWSFEELPGGRVHISISHDLKKPRFLGALALADWALGKLFVRDNASKTLSGIKRRVEAQVMHPIIALQSPTLKAAKLRS